MIVVRSDDLTLLFAFLLHVAMSTLQWYTSGRKWRKSAHSKHPAFVQPFFALLVLIEHRQAFKHPNPKIRRELSSNMMAKNAEVSQRSRWVCSFLVTSSPRTWWGIMSTSARVAAGSRSLLYLCFSFYCNQGLEQMLRIKINFCRTPLLTQLLWFLGRPLSARIRLHS